MGIPTFPPAPGAYPCDVPGPWLRQGGKAELRLLRMLGEGAQGVVYEVQQRLPPQSMQRALKLFRPPNLEALSPDRVRDLVHSFRMEAEYGLEHRSPHLAATLRPLDLSEYTEAGWPPVGLLMEYFGTTLLKVLRWCRDEKHKLPLDLVERWTQGLANGLVALGQIRRVHRDIVPGNIGVTNGDLGALSGSDLVLFDFGVVCPEDSHGLLPMLQDQPKRWLGPGRPWKDPYFYPESASASHPRPPFTRAADIYAFGRVCEALAEVMDGPRAWLDEVVRRCCDEAPADRPQPADLLPMLRRTADPRTELAEICNWDDDLRKDFVGRKFVRERFERFAEECRQSDHGGVFLIRGPSGIGKSALLAQWVYELGMAPCYFYKWQQHIRAADMAIKVEEWLATLYGIAKKPEGHTWQTSDLIELFRDVSPRLGDGRLILFLDALDEAERPDEAVKWIPTGKLPDGVFFVITSRPAANLSDHLLPLAHADSEGRGQKWLEKLDLSPHDEDNRKDLRLYFDQLVGDGTTEAQRERLVEASGGFFRIASLLAPRILKQKREDRSAAVEDILERSRDWAGTDEAETIFRFYQSDIQRAQAEKLELLPDFARLIVAARDWMSEEEAEAILNYKEQKKGGGRRWHTSRIRSIRAALTWLLERQLQTDRDGRKQWCFKYQHTSVRDFLVSPAFEGPACSGVPEMHRSVASYFLSRAKREGWIGTEYYGRCYTVRHLLEMGSPKAIRKAAELLSSLDYLQATLGDGSSTREDRREGGEA